ncbi:putative membrane protein [Microbacterium endophyticum]|uniref:Putative membrane protein n=1 Tax=Microbacterium endophyticum TaxID=1526412 RepID=A0A7W4V2V9_9MICO|nr:DUF1345 domain-containing protein [Microbacterium endophyticum]MBB2975825.1 putative membrane protein [Microbacterium endophyticum]NIK36308.1 putative membrane protein [Microbacterium endophyticum]
MPTHQRHTGALVIALRLADIVVQIALIAIGSLFLLGDASAEAVVGWLLLWCSVGSLYWVATVAISAWTVEHPVPRESAVAEALDQWPAVRWITTIANLTASSMGLWAAAVLILFRDDPDWAGTVKVVAVWAMLLSWALFHWGFTRVYQRRYNAAIEKPLRFPATEHPRLVDFLYFSFTCGTAFSVSDVEVRTTSMRWIVMWHTVIGFFLNALIIVLAVNTIIS